LNFFLMDALLLFASTSMRPCESQPPACVEIGMLRAPLAISVCAELVFQPPCAAKGGPHTNFKEAAKSEQRSAFLFSSSARLSVLCYCCAAISHPPVCRIDCAGDSCLRCSILRSDVTIGPVRVTVGGRAAEAGEEGQTGQEQARETKWVSGEGCWLEAPACACVDALGHDAFATTKTPSVTYSKHHIATTNLNKAQLYQHDGTAASCLNLTKCRFLSSQISRTSFFSGAYRWCVGNSCRQNFGRTAAPRRRTPRDALLQNMIEHVWCASEMAPVATSTSTLSLSPVVFS